MKKYLFIILGLFIGTVVEAQTMIVKPDPEKLLRNTPVEDVSIKYKPIVSDITDTTAKVTVSKDYPLSKNSNNQFYFEYGEQIACPAIYPTPEYCLPKITNKDGLEAILKDLKPGSQYYVRFVKDSSIRCIKAPCPSDKYISETTEFTTPTNVVVKPIFTGNLRLGMTEEMTVPILQDKLRSLGFLKTKKSTMYYGQLTQKAVRDYQTKVMKTKPTGVFDNQTFIHMFGIK